MSSLDVLIGVTAVVTQADRRLDRHGSDVTVTMIGVTAIVTQASRQAWLRRDSDPA